MRTTIDIKKELLEEAFNFSGVSTKKALVELSLKIFIREKKKERLKEKLGNFDLDLDQNTLREMRKND